MTYVFRRFKVLLAFDAFDTVEHNNSMKLLLHVLIPLLVGGILSDVSGNLPDDETFRQFLQSYYSDPHQPVLNVSDDQVLVPVKPAPLPFPPDHPPVPPVIDITILEDQLYAEDGFAYQKFGQQIASASSVVAVNSNSAGTQSKVYLYEEHTVDGAFQGFTAIGSVTSQSSKQDGFGTSLALSQDVLVVGAPQDNAGGFSSGKVYVFEAKGLHNPLQTLTAGTTPPPKKGSLFGRSVSLCGNTLAVGAPGYSSDLSKGSGAVYLFETDESPVVSFAQTSLLLPPTTSQPPFGQFGSTVQLQQDFLSVAAVADSTTVLNGGAVYLYSYSAASADDNTTTTSGTALSSEAEWVLTQELQPDSLSSYAYFGHSLAFRGSLGLIAAFNEEGSGVVYVYTAGADGVWSLSTMLQPTDAGDSYNNFGSSLCLHQAVSKEAAVQPVIAVVGSSGDSTNNEMAGAIYVFGVKDATTRVSFLLLDKLTNHDSAAFDAYGASTTATDSGHVLVGAPQADSSVSLTSGVVYIESNLIPYYLEVVQNVNEEEVSDDVSGGSSPSLAQLVRDALLSTVGIVLLAVIPIVTVSGIVGVIALRGGFSKHRYQSASQAVDAHGNVLDKNGDVIVMEGGLEPVTASSSNRSLSSYAYFVNPLKRSKVQKSGSMDLQSISSEGSAANHRVTRSTDLDTLYAPVDIHSTIRSPMNSDHTIYPSPIAVPPRVTRDVVMPTDEESKC